MSLSTCVLIFDDSAPAAAAPSFRRAAPYSVAPVRFAAGVTPDTPKMPQSTARSGFNAGSGKIGDV